jgi:hypothetical protein
MEVAVRDDIDLGQPDFRLAQDVLDPSGFLVVPILELLAAEAEARVEEKHAFAPPDRVGNDNAELTRPLLVGGEREPADVERDDLGPVRRQCRLLICGDGQRFGISRWRRRA